MKLADRVDAIEKALVLHIEESGAIRADLRWLKWAVCGLAGLIVTATITELVGKIFIR